MSKFGWCMGPVGAILKHSECPGLAGMGNDGTYVVCDCDCHDQGE